MTSLLEGKHVTKHFGGLKAVEKVDFRLDEGEILGLIGPNGAGKTTLFSVIAGSIRPTAGSIVLGGKNVAGWPSHRVVHAGICRTHQIVRPFSKLTVLENVAVGVFYGKVRSKSNAGEALELLDFLGIRDAADRLPGQLTLASRKKLEIARALATMPRILLLDEVVGGLNPTEAQQLSEIIRRIRKDRDLSIIMTEHVMPAVMGLSDRVMVLDEGRKIAEGSAKEVAGDPKVIEAYLGSEGTASEGKDDDARS